MRALALFLFALPAMAQTAGSAMPFVKPQWFTGNGSTPAAGYKLCAFAAGTTSPILTYSTSALNVPNSNPVILDSSGRAAVFMSPVSYKFALLLPSSTTTDCVNGTMSAIWTQDNIANNADLLKAALAASTGAGIVGFSQTASYPAGTVGKALQDTISITDGPYFAICDSGSTDNTAKIQAALNTGKSIFAPGCSGYYGVTGVLNLTAMYQSVYGVGPQSKIVSTGTNSNATVFLASSLGHNQFRGLNIIPGTTVSSQNDGFAVKFSSSDYGLVDNLESSGYRRGAVMVANSNHTTVTNSFFHDATSFDTGDANDAGNDVYIYGSSSYNIFTDSQIYHGAGVGCAILTSGSGTDVADYNECSHLKIDGEGRYGAIAYQNSTDEILYNRFHALSLHNMSGNTAEHSGDHAGGMGVYIADAEFSDIEDITCNHFNVYQPTVLTHTPGCVGVAAENVKVQNVTAIDGGSYAFSQIVSFASAADNPQSTWTNISYDSLHTGGLTGAICFKQADTVNVTVKNLHCGTTTGAAGAPAVSDEDGLHHTQANHHVYEDLDIHGYTGGSVVQATGGKWTQVVRGQFADATGDSLALASARTDIKDAQVTLGTGGAGVVVASNATSGFVTGNSVIGGADCYDILGSLYIDGSNTSSGCATTWVGGVGPYYVLDNSATPSVSGLRRLFVKTDTTTITNFTGGQPGQVITILFDGVTATINYTGTVSTPLGTNFVGQSGDSITFEFQTSHWQCTGYSVNHS